MTVKNVPLPPTRGTIYSDDGYKLAYSTPIQSLYITLQKDYSKSTDRGKENRPEALALAEKLKEVFDQYGDPNAAPMTEEAIVKAMDLDYRLQGGYAPRQDQVWFNP